LESAERISKALENIDERMESARQSAQDDVKYLGQFDSIRQNMEEETEEDDLIIFSMELLKLSLENNEQLIQSMREIQKKLFSTRNKRIEEAIKYIEQVCDKYDNNFNNQLRLKKPKYIQWLMQSHKELGLQEEQKTMDEDRSEMVVTTEITPKESIDDAYKILALVFHPDKGGDTDRFKKINNAYERLQNVADKIESHKVLMYFPTTLVKVVNQCDDVNKFDDIQKILAEKS